MTNRVYDADPAWSPKEDQIAFRRRDRSGDRKNSDVYVIDADGKSEAMPLTNDPDADEQNASWSPSGDEIAHKSKAKTAAWPGPTLDRVRSGSSSNAITCAGCGRRSVRYVRGIAETCSACLGGPEIRANNLS